MAVIIMIFRRFFTPNYRGNNKMAIPNLLAKFNRRSTGLLSVALVAAFLGDSPPVQAAFVINPSFDATISNDANATAIMAAINSAIGAYQGFFNDPLTVNIKFAAMTTGLGQSSTWLAPMSYANYHAALVADAKSVSDATALAHLPAGLNNPVNGGPNLYLSTANIKALGGSATTTDGFDGTVFLNTLVTHIGSPSTTGQYDLMAVVQHEVDEVLGLGSALGSGLANIRAEDLFRYSFSGVRSFTTAGDDAYFSIDGGVTQLARFNQSADGDRGDWWSIGAHVPQVQDAFGTPDAHPLLGDPELTALDVIGYNRISAVPEPASLSLIGLVGCLLWASQVRRRYPVRPITAKNQ
jgi:hypothetical protein